MRLSWRLILRTSSSTSLGRNAGSNSGGSRSETLTFSKSSSASMRSWESITSRSTSRGRVSLPSGAGRGVDRRQSTSSSSSDSALPSATSSASWCVLRNSTCAWVKTWRGEAAATRSDAEDAGNGGCSRTKRSATSSKCSWRAAWKTWPGSTSSSVPPAPSPAAAGASTPSIDHVAAKTTQPTMRLAQRTRLEIAGSSTSCSSSTCTQLRSAPRRRAVQTQLTPCRREMKPQSFRQTLARPSRPRARSRRNPPMRGRVDHRAGSLPLPSCINGNKISYLSDGTIRADP